MRFRVFKQIPLPPLIYLQIELKPFKSYDLKGFLISTFYQSFKFRIKFKMEDQVQKLGIMQKD